jgi:hypothetical protein
MTLVLTALTPKHVVQVSDRRVTLQYRDGREYARDNHVKAVVTQWFACSYTGIADLGGSDTADWLALMLSDHVNDVDGGISALAKTLHETVGAPTDGSRRLAVVCAGWRGELGSMEPMATLMTNFGAVGDTHDFHLLQFNVPRGRRSNVLAAPPILTASEHKQTERSVERLCKSGRNTARAIAQVLTQRIRAVAQTADRGRYVSEEVLITSLPRHDLLRGSFVVGALVEDWWSVTHVPAGSSRQERHGGPIIVGDKAVVQALPPEAGPPGVPDASVAARVIRPPEGPVPSLGMMILTNPPLGSAWGWPGVDRPPRSATPEQESAPAPK